MKTNDELSYGAGEERAPDELRSYAELCGFFSSLRSLPEYDLALRLLRSAGQPTAISADEYAQLRTVWRQAMAYRYDGEDFMALDDDIRSAIRRARFASLGDFKNSLLPLLAGATLTPTEIATSDPEAKDRPVTAVVLTFRRTSAKEAPRPAADAEKVRLAAKSKASAGSRSVRYEGNAEGLPFVLAEEMGRVLLRGEWKRRPVRLQVAKGDDVKTYSIAATDDPLEFRVDIPVLKRKALFAALGGGTERLVLLLEDAS